MINILMKINVVLVITQLRRQGLCLINLINHNKINSNKNNSKINHSSNNINKINNNNNMNNNSSHFKILNNINMIVFMKMTFLIQIKVAIH